MGGAFSRVVEPPPEEQAASGEAAPVVALHQSAPATLGAANGVVVRMRSASGSSDVLLLPSSSFARQHTPDRPLRPDPQASNSSYFELDRVARLSPHLLQHIAEYLSVPHEEVEGFLRHLEVALPLHPGAHLLTNPLEYLLRPHCRVSADAFLSFFFGNVCLRGPSNITRAMEERTLAREVGWLVEVFVARALYARYLAVLSAGGTDSELAPAPPSPPECLPDSDRRCFAVFARYFPHYVGPVMATRAPSNTDQITRSKLDASERDALRRQLTGALELMLPDLKDSKVHEVLAACAAADGPPIAPVSEPSGERDAQASESDHSGQASDPPSPIHPAEAGEGNGQSKGKGKQKAEKDPREQFEDHLVAMDTPGARQQLCELWRRDLGELQRFGWLDAPTFDKVPTCPHERKVADYSDFLRAREPLVVGEWPLLAPEAQMSTSQPGPSRLRNSSSKPMSTTGPSLSTPTPPHDIVWVDVEPRQHWTGLSEHPVLWRLGAKFVDVPFLPELGCGCVACLEKWMLADFLAQLPALRSVPWPTYDAETTASWAAYHVGATRRALAAELGVDPSGVDPSAYQARSAELAAIEQYVTEIARRVFATHGEDGAAPWLQIGAWLSVHLGIWEEGGRTYTGTVVERVGDLLLGVLWCYQCVASEGGMPLPVQDVQPAQDVQPVQPAHDFDQVIAPQSAVAGDTAAPPAPKLRPEGLVYVTKQRKLWAQKPRKPLPKNAVARLASQEAAAKAAAAAASGVGRSKTATVSPITPPDALAHSNGVPQGNITPGPVAKPANGKAVNDKTVNGKTENGKTADGKPANANGRPVDDKSVNGKTVNAKPANGKPAVKTPLKAAVKPVNNIFMSYSTPPNGAVDVLFPNPPDPAEPVVHAKVAAIAALHESLTALPPEERTDERTAHLFERARLQASATEREVRESMLLSADYALSDRPPDAPAACESAPRQVRPEVAREVGPEVARQSGLTDMWIAIRLEIEDKLGRPLTRDDEEEIHLRAGEAAQMACFQWVEEKLAEERAEKEKEKEVAKRKAKQVAKREAEEKAAREVKEKLEAEEKAAREEKEKVEREPREREEAERQRQQEEEQFRRQRQVARDMERQRPNKKKAKAKRTK